MAITEPLFGGTVIIHQTGERPWGSDTTGILQKLVQFANQLGNLITSIAFWKYSTTVDSITDGGTLTVTRNLHRVAGDIGPVTIVLGNGTDDGQILVIEGTSDTNSVKIDHLPAGNVRQNGNITLVKSDKIQYTWNSSEVAWIESGRNC